MNPCDPVLAIQRPMIQKIVADETWLEGERRGRFVESTDPVVRHNVCTVVLQIGADMRAKAMSELAADNQSRLGEVEVPARSAAA